MTLVLAILAAISFALYLWQFLLGIRFRFNTDATATSFPPITILKPLKGYDSETESSLRTWLEQDYPAPIQILFGVACEADSAVKLVREKLKQNAIICPESVGPNAKVSTLAQLEPLIQHDLVIISDADVAVPKDFLRRVAAVFQSERPDLASCLYRFTGAANLPTRLESFIVNSDFWTQVLQSTALKPMNFALGAAMIITRPALTQIGGFHPLADYLADDYQLGNRVKGKVSLCPIVVDCRLAPMTWREMFAHQIRWARTIRVCQPLPFFFSLLSIPSLWIIAWAAASAAWAPAAIALGLRSLLGAILERKLTRQFHASSLILAPITDILRAFFWLLAFTGNRIYWAGKRLRVSRGGQLLPLL